MYKKSDLVYLDRPDCEWVAKIADVDLKTSKFTIANAIIKFKTTDQDEEDIEEQEHDEDIEEQDDDRIDLLDSPDTEDSAEFISDWQALVSTLSPEQMPSVVHQFPLDFITRYADSYELDVYMDLIQNWKDNTFGETDLVVEKKNKRGLIALDN